MVSVAAEEEEEGRRGGGREGKGRERRGKERRSLGSSLLKLNKSVGRNRRAPVLSDAVKLKFVQQQLGGQEGQLEGKEGRKEESW